MGEQEGRIPALRLQYSSPPELIPYANPLTVIFIQQCLGFMTGVLYTNTIQEMTSILKFYPTLKTNKQTRLSLHYKLPELFVLGYYNPYNKILTSMITLFSQLMIFNF